MTIQIEVVSPEGQLATYPFEAMPRTGEWLELPDTHPLVVTHVVHRPAHTDFQARIHTEFVPLSSTAQG